MPSLSKGPTSFVSAAIVLFLAWFLLSGTGYAGTPLSRLPLAVDTTEDPGSKAPPESTEVPDSPAAFTAPVAETSKIESARTDVEGDLRIEPRLDLSILLPQAQRRPSDSKLPALEDRWSRIVGRFAAALVDPDARADETPLFVPGASVRAFGASATSDPGKLANRFNHHRIIAARAWTTPTTIGLEELTRDFEAAAELIDPLVLRALIPSPPERVQAQATLNRWTNHALDLQKDDRFGIIVLYDLRTESAASGGDASGVVSPNDVPVGLEAFARVTFILVKGRQLSDGRWRLEKVRYGTLIETLRNGY